MADIRQIRKALVTRVLEGDGKASHTQRRAAFNNKGLAEPLRTLINKVANQPTQITDDDITMAKVSGVSEDQIFELVICAAIGESTRQYESALKALAEATMDKEGNKYASQHPQ